MSFTKKETSLFQSLWPPKTAKSLETPTLSTSALAFVTATENGSLRPEADKTLWREKLKLNFTTVKATTRKFTPETSAGVTKGEKWTLWFTPSLQCFFTQVTLLHWKAKWTTRRLNLWSLETWPFVPRRKNDSPAMISWF